MPTNHRRAAARRRAWGRGPIILRFEPLEGRSLLATAAALPDLVGQSFQAPSSLTLGQSFTVNAVVENDGAATVASTIQVEFYVSPAMGIAPGAVGIGSATIPAGLAPGSTADLSQQVTLPTTLTGVGASGQIYVGMSIDPNDLIQESNKQNNYGVGLGIDTALATLTTPAAAALVGQGLQLSTNQTDWGGTITVTEQIANTGAGDAPATTALVVLTPSGVAPGGSSDVTIGNISVPALAAGQSTTVTQTINLSPTPPPVFAGVSSYTLSLVQDADYLTNIQYPHVATQGLGLDQAAMTIDTPSYAPALPAALPELEVTGVYTPNTTIAWGQSLQVGATIENAGSADSGPVRIRYLLVGTDGALNGLFLGDTEINNLAAGASTGLVWTVSLPTIPPGVLNSNGEAAIAVVLDPEHTIVQSSTADNAGFTSVLTFQSAAASTSTTPVTTTPAAAAATPAVTTPAAATVTAAAKRAALEAAVAAARAKAKAKAAAKPKPKPVERSLSTDLKALGDKVATEYRKIVKKR